MLLGGTSNQDKKPAASKRSGFLGGYFKTNTTTNPTKADGSQTIATSNSNSPEITPKKTTNSFWRLEDSVTIEPLSNSNRKRSSPKPSPLDMKFIVNTGKIKMLGPFRNEKSLSAEEALNQMKKQVVRSLDLYISKWKFPLFGHHHNGRAIKTKTAILKADTAQLVIDILRNQHNIMNNINKSTSHAVSDLLGDYALLSNLKNKPKSAENSEYAQIIKMAMDLQKDIATTSSPFQTPSSLEL